LSQYLTPTEFRTFGLSQAALASYSDDQIAQFLIAASDWADGYLRSRYQLPLVFWSQDLKIACAQYAVYLILNHRGYDATDPTGAQVYTTLKQAEKFWEDVNSGVRSLEVVETSSTPRLGARMYSRPQRGW